MISTAQYSVDGVAIKIVAASQTPKDVIVHVENSAIVYLGASTVTGTTGLLADKTAGPISMQLDAEDELWAIAKSGTHVVTVLERFI